MPLMIGSSIPASVMMPKEEDGEHEHAAVGAIAEIPLMICFPVSRPSRPAGHPAMGITKSTATRGEIQLRRNSDQHDANHQKAKKSPTSAPSHR